MDYLVTFLEGILTFISPCLLPMLPIYLAYFARTSNELVANGATCNAHTQQTFVRALGFVGGFTIVFVALGALAGQLGSFITHYQTAFNVVCGAIVIIFGLHFAGILHIRALDRTLGPHASQAPVGFLSCVLFGIVFAIGWTPCVGVFLGSALLLASTQGSLMHGITLLLVYSIGLGVPFLVAALVIDQLAGTIDAIKRHYRTINMVCAVLLVIVGILMMLGMFGTWLAILSV